MEPETVYTHEQMRTPFVGTQINDRSYSSYSSSYGNVGCFWLHHTIPPFDDSGSAENRTFNQSGAFPIIPVQCYYGLGVFDTLAGYFMVVLTSDLHGHHLYTGLACIY
jgi:hypothetical protein